MKATTERGELIGGLLTCFADERILSDGMMLAVYRGLAGVCLCAFLAVLGAGCGGDGKDGAAGAQGPQGPAGADGQDGESYVSYTNPVNGQVTTIAVEAGDNSPVEIVINVVDGGGSAGQRNEAAAAAEPAAGE